MRRYLTSVLLLNGNQEKTNVVNDPNPIPYVVAYVETILSEFTGFSRIITKSQESTVVVQNRTPGALYMLPPGPLKVKLTQ